MARGNDGNDGDGSDNPNAGILADMRKDLEELDAEYAAAVKLAGWDPAAPETPKPKRGGRPRGARRIPVMLTLDPMAIEILDDTSAHYGMPRGRIVDRLLLAMGRPEPDDRKKR